MVAEHVAAHLVEDPLRPVRVEVAHRAQREQHVSQPLGVGRIGIEEGDEIVGTGSPHAQDILGLRQGGQLLKSAVAATLEATHRR